MIKRHFFTLLELLISISIALILATVLTASLSSGIKVFYKVKQTQGLNNAGLALMQISNDIENAINNTLLPFESDSNSIKIPSILHENQLGFIVWKIKNKKLLRQEIPYTKALPTNNQFFKDVGIFNLQVNQQNKRNLPHSITVTIACNSQQVQRHIWLPSSRITLISNDEKK